MKIAILGTRGIPNNYGGFEQFAEYLSVGLVKAGIEVYVYNSHNHPFKENEWNGVHIIHQYDPEYKIGTAGQFIYDLNCILNCRKHKFDIILQLGYTSSSIWSFLFPKYSCIVTNMDGLEWKRSKYSDLVQRFLKYAEKLAVKKSDFLVADSIGIKKYLKESYNVSSSYIPYGATVFRSPNENILKDYKLEPYNYFILIARLEPENSIEIILDGYIRSNKQKKLIIIANHRTKYGNYLIEKYRNEKYIGFLGSIYDINILNNLRYFSSLYFHGHTVGGTNPSLLEAMASSALIVANRNEFNEAILKEDALYFNTLENVTSLFDVDLTNSSRREKIANNISKIEKIYSWPQIVESYNQLFLKIVKENRR